MNELSKIKKGRIYFKIIIFLVTGLEIAFVIKIASIEYGDLFGAFIKALLFVTLIILTFQYSKKWLAIFNSIVFIGYGGIMLTGWFMEKDYFMLINSFAYIYVGLIIIISKDIRAYLKVKRTQVPAYNSDTLSTQTQFGHTPKFSQNQN